MHKPSIEITPEMDRHARFEVNVINALPDQFMHANLIEITESSYLIQNQIKLPILGKKCEMFMKQDRLKPYVSNLLARGKTWARNQRPMSKDLDEVRNDGGMETSSISKDITIGDKNPSEQKKRMQISSNQDSIKHTIERHPNQLHQ